MSRPTILLSGFEPFGGERINPSMLLVQAMAQRGSDCAQLHTLVLPVVRERADEQLLAAIDELSPTHVLMFGEAGGRAQVTPERVAINVDDYRITDNAGQQPRGEAIVDDGPVGYFSSLPIAVLVAAMRQAGVPAQISDSAGTYLCNRVFYRAMHHIAQSAAALQRTPQGLHQVPMQAGFIHLPWLHEQVVHRDDASPSVSLAVLIDAAEAMLAALAADCAD